jgi:hypothetical protein
MDYSPKLVLDSRIYDISDKVDVAVESSGSQSTYQPYPSTNTSNSSINFNCNIPSENIAVDRRVLLSSDFNFTVTIVNATGHMVLEDKPAFEWGKTDGLGQFPMNGSFSQVQATINNTNISTPLDDVMAPLLRMCDQESVSKMNLTTASYIDQNYASLNDIRESPNNPLNGFYSVNYNNKIQPRGVILPKSISVLHTAPAVSDTSLISLGIEGEQWVIGITVSLTEPLLFLSPFSGLVKANNDACFLGINNINLLCNISSNLGGIYKTTMPKSVTVTPGLNDGTPLFSNPRLLFNFLTLQPEQWSRINTKNVLPIQSYARFASSSTGTIADGAPQTFTFPIIQLSKIPDTILIFVRPPKNLTSPDGVQFKRQTRFLTIKNASISFNNASGILSSASPEELYNISKKNGSQQIFQEFVGQANVNQTNTSETGMTEASPAFKSIATQGSLLVVKPSFDFNLPSFLSAGSLGAYGLQITLQCNNFTGDEIVNPEMCVVTVDSGVMVTQQGQSSLYSGLLTKEMVLDAKQQKPVMDSNTYTNLVGGSVQESCKTALRNVLKKHFGSSKSMEGSGKSGGSSQMIGSGKSGGGQSGGKLSQYT